MVFNMNLCIEAFNQATQRRQEVKPYHELLQRTAQKIREIVKSS
ncbi:hypothetical protein [Floridanema flaviceps]